MYLSNFFKRFIKIDSRLSTRYEVPKPACNHKWKGFHWYLQCQKDDDKINITIIKPYVCVVCRKTEKVVLSELEFKGEHSLKDIQQILFEKYSELRPMAEVMAEVCDYKYIDK